jgi:hypothetical protein
VREFPFRLPTYFQLEAIVDSEDAAIKQRIHSSLFLKLQSVDGAYVVSKSPDWRIRVHVLVLPLVAGFGVPVVASVVGSMVSTAKPALPLAEGDVGAKTSQPRAAPAETETVFRHYQIMRESGEVEAFADAIVDDLETQLWGALRRGTRAVLTGGAKNPVSQNDGPGDQAKATRDYFTIGSSIEEVLRVQGEPTQLQQGSSFENSKIYWWGVSSVTFTSGKVSEFSNIGGNLRIRVTGTR